MNYVKRLLAALLICSTSLPSLAAVTASLDHDHVAPGDTVQLLLQSDHSPDGQPDLGPLKNDFIILGTSSGSSMQIINGRVSSQAQLSLALSPKHEGKIRIPPLLWGGEPSPALELTVESNGAGRQSNGKAAGGITASNGSDHFFITTSVDHDQPYLQSAVLLTVRVYIDQALYQASLELPSSSDVLVQQLGKDQQGSETRNGHAYQVVERKYLLSPQHSGQITLQGPILDATVAEVQNSDPFGSDPIFGRIFGQMQLPGVVTSTRPLHLQSKPIVLKVLPRPADATGTNWLPAQSMTLEESWNPADASVHAGEPLTRHLRLSALGLSGAQLPDIDTLMQAPEGIKLYPDKSHTDDKQQGNTILGKREQDIALIASQPGHYELPAVHLAWWDTAANVQREVTLPKRTLNILPALSGSGGAVVSPAQTAVPANPPPSIGQPKVPVKPEQAASAELWALLGLGILVVFGLGIALGWWRKRRSLVNTVENKIEPVATRPDVSGVSAFNAFQQACRNNDPHAARKHLLIWAGTVWPEQPPSGVNALTRLLDGKFAKPLRDMDRACYTDSAWQGESLVRILATPPVRSAPAKREQALPDLYP